MISADCLHCGTVANLDSMTVLCESCYESLCHTLMKT